jgi:hypothetical protein
MAKTSVNSFHNVFNLEKLLHILLLSVFKRFKSLASIVERLKIANFKHIITQGPCRAETKMFLNDIYRA